MGKLHHPSTRNGSQETLHTAGMTHSLYKQKAQASEGRSHNCAMHDLTPLVKYLAEWAAEIHYRESVKAQEQQISDPAK